MDNTLTTSADELFELVKSRKKIPVDEAAKILKIPTNIIQSLVDFLVEERIFGIEYKFTTPYVYFNESGAKKIKMPDLKKEVETSGIASKDEFFQKARQWNVAGNKITEMWKRYLTENMPHIKDVFYSKAKDRDIEDKTIEKLWLKYKTYLV
jgi:hypothetical protein